MLEGKLLSDRYQVKRLIGGGGMANVYLGYDTILEREVAIKALKLEYANDDEFISRFHREAQSATSLSHPNIVSMYDVDDEDGIYFMVMEYVEGMTLKKFIQHYGPISVEESIFIMEQICSAIEHAHDNHIVHRDIKPQNILVSPQKQVKVTDFGIALALSATSLTQTNSVLGSVHYLSPEQARGGVANKKSDIYSLGIVFFELLTGRIPFSGQSAVSIALKHLQANTPSIKQWMPEIPQSIENIVFKATAKDPFHRYQNIKQLEADLSTALTPERINEPAYVQPEEPGDATRAIPIVTDQQLEAGGSADDTIIHSKQSTEPTKIVESSDQKVNKQKKPKKKMSKKKKVFIWVATIVLVFLVASLLALFVLPNLLQPDDVEVPDLTNEHIVDAEELLTDLGLLFEREAVFSDEIDAEHVVRTDPEAEATVKEGSTITLFVSQGAETEEFDDYVGQAYSQVERLLLQRGYDDVEREDVYSDEPAGTILAHISPEAGSDVIPGDTTVIFEVSIGTRTISLDDLVGLDEARARQYLTSNGLVANVTEEHSASVSEGDVIRQSPSPGTDVEEGAVVNLVLSLGEEELPPITHAITFNVPYTGTPSQDTGDEDDEDNNEPPSPQRQEVRIYIDDMNHSLGDLYETDTIVEDREFTIRLVIAPNSTATYKVERDDQVILQRTVAYEDVEGD
ncbi:serine/threonine protein kinase [Amphibacillus marinus]|uniref:Serine/threonine-protein kinase PrkC n=1 Tax=Amphibacillus marinus TaxID=872970 RepID=A0A1H8HYD8_9BACI|nr:Stk1 family PASTA domain-containing Ser/Thr kinase [Amphibacillus marinus]SEN61081.1 serine/threonine protein kinase [Amphibacillus marinus]